jgi:hypothetical protein
MIGQLIASFIISVVGIVVFIKLMFSKGENVWSRVTVFIITIIFLIVLIHHSIVLVNNHYYGGVN